ncbi:hypothetical protein [Cyclobacterium plantarum]|uniref:WD40-like Beta Propeller Repeat n=1 Tax=Cyclobacterium plantarum TaxID=2716263 RepID=A0ABX0H2K0_9BACT|nr:hypothetical protein [Cyclobacterium plantarum]NHE56016.1 hypothetical protein [Cyclobacterium plantarum]
MKLSISTFFGDFQIPLLALTIVGFLFCSGCQAEKDQAASAFSLQIEQLTSGTKHHFFGYIGQCQTIPWNESGQYILGMEIDTISRMPGPDEPATIFVIDTEDENNIIPLDQTYAWNPQQGTMFYWNPLAPETQFFFNDRDLETGKIFTVIYDIRERKRIKEYRYEDSPIANGGVAANGSAWLGINYGRLARLRPVTGYPGVPDWSEEEIAPKNDGIFTVDVKTSEKKLLVSYHQLDEKIRESNPDLQHSGLFINHTLWNRNSDRIYFFARAGWGPGDDSSNRVNVPITINSDGTGLTFHSIFVGGHPEWDEGNILIGSAPDDLGKKRQVLYDVEHKQIQGYMGDSVLFPNPEGDISLSPDANWFANGFGKNGKNYYTILRRNDGVWAKSEGIDKGDFSGDIRIDPAPRWNRTNDAILVPGIAPNGTRQMFLIQVLSNKI